MVVAPETVHEQQTSPAKARKAARARRFDRTTLPQIQRWNRTVLPLLYTLGGEIVSEFKRRYGGNGKASTLYQDLGWLAELPEDDFIPSSGSGYGRDDERPSSCCATPVVRRKVGNPETLLGKPVGSGLLFDATEWADKFEAQGRPIAAEAVKQAGLTAAAEIGRERFDPTTTVVRRALGDRVRQYSKFVNEGTDKIVQTQIRAGIRAGESIGDIAARLESRLHPKDFRITGRFTSLHHRANTIARTEIVGAHNLGNQQGMAQADVRTRIWISMGDDRVRRSHELLDGKEKALGKPWNVSGSSMDFPNDVNERCTEGPGRIGRRRRS